MTLSNFNGLDYLFCGIFLFFIVLSLWRGLVKEIISILAWLAGLVIAFNFAPKLAAVFASPAGSQAGEQMAGPSTFTLGLCFVVLLVGTLIIGAIINYCMTIVVEDSGLSFFNRFLGGVFGFAKAFVIELVLVFFVQMTSYAQSPVWQKSEFVNAYQPVIASLESKFGSNIEEIKEKINEMKSQTHQ